jgi:hypothetical protein
VNNTFYVILSIPLFPLEAIFSSASCCQMFLNPCPYPGATVFTHVQKKTFKIIVLDFSIAVITDKRKNLN